MESLFGGIQVKPSVLHGERQRQVSRHPLLYLHDHGSGHRSIKAAERCIWLSDVNMPVSLHLVVQATCGAATLRQWMGSRASLTQPPTMATTRRSGA